MIRRGPEGHMRTCYQCSTWVVILFMIFVSWHEKHVMYVCMYVCVYVYFPNFLQISVIGKVEIYKRDNTKISILGKLNKDGADE